MLPTQGWTYTGYPSPRLCCLPYTGGPNSTRLLLALAHPTPALTNSLINPSRCIYQWYLCWILTSPLSLLKRIGWILTILFWCMLPIMTLKSWVSMLRLPFFKWNYLLLFFANRFWAFLKVILPLLFNFWLLSVAFVNLCTSSICFFAVWWHV